MAGEFGTTIEFGRISTRVEAGEVGSFDVTVNVGNQSSGDDLDVDAIINLYVGGTQDSNIVASEEVTVTENDIIEGTLSHTFSEKQSYPNDVSVFAEVLTEYYGAPGYTKGSNVDDEVARSDTRTVTVTKPVDEPSIAQVGGPSGQAGQSVLSQTFAGRTEFEIREIQLEDDAIDVETLFPQYTRTPEGQDDTGGIIQFDFPNPSISIDTAGRFAKHEIIGGSTVRQKIGEDPLNISVEGVCTERTASKIDALRDAKSGKIFNDRFPGGAVVVQFGSTSTSPIEDGGGADLETGEFLYTYSINCIEIIR